MPDFGQNAAGISWHQQVELAEGSSAETGGRGSSKSLLESAECDLRCTGIAGHNQPCARDRLRIKHIARALGACQKRVRCG